MLLTKGMKISGLLIVPLLLPLTLLSSIVRKKPRLEPAPVVFDDMAAFPLALEYWTVSPVIGGGGRAELVVRSSISALCSNELV